MKRVLVFLVFASCFASTAFATSSINSQLSNNCPNSSFVGNCSGCHNDSAAYSAARSGDWSFFCSQVDPNDVDDDNDGFTENQGDCNDNNRSINPDATEICGDGIDQDCSGMDMNCPTDPNDVDDDGDGFTENQGDCNDNNRSINPDATEICGDGIDQDCSGMDMNCPTDPNDVDDDNDGLTENQGDCNDNNASIRPGATEICGDNIDQDCSGMDLTCPPNPTCTDDDNDGFSAMTQGLDCGPVDCNDNDPAINPGAAERCSDGVDNNCDGLTDGMDTVACPAPSTPTCTDADMDGFFAEMGCNTMVDCNDNDRMIFPGATELCGDSMDNDCDGNVDEGCDMGGNEDGMALYENNCASCHQMLGNSDVCGEDAEEIMEAIAENEGGMSFLSSLSDAQIKSIAEALANCRQDDDNDEQPELSDSDSDSDDDGRKRRSKKERRSRRD